MSDFIVRNWGNLASVAGLVFSFLAFIFSKRASAAAREARDAAMRQSMGADMDGAARTANEISTYIRSDKTDMALLRISDLMNQTSYLVARWDARLSKKSKDNLVLGARPIALHAWNFDRERGKGLAPEEKGRLAHDGQRVSEICDEERGTAATGLGN